MKILSVTAQKPDSTGSGIYLTELVRGFKKKGISDKLLKTADNGRIMRDGIRTVILGKTNAGKSSLLIY